MKLLIFTLCLVSAVFHSTSASESDCKVNFTEEHGTIISSNATTANKNCTWIINLPPTKLIKFFFSRVSMRNPENSCINNLSINETINGNDSSLGLFCNDSTPLPLTTTTSTARITFQSNNSMLQNSTNSHFQLIWMSLDNPNVTQTCSKAINEPSGALMSPNYPNGNPLPFNCTYKIIQSPGKIIQLSLNDLHITNDNKTCNNRLNIYDGDDENPTMIASICDSKYYVPSRVFNSSTNYMTIRIITETPLAKYQGFHGVFETIDNRCGGLLKENGSIHNPGFGAEHEANIRCKWRIQAPKDKVVTMKYSSFNIAWDPLCENDYVAVTEVHANGTRGMPSKHCGPEIPGAIISNTSVVDVEFRSKTKDLLKGFKLDYSIVDNKGDK
ncbi:procollagen C-endopeptidase enhancer 2-like [Diachasmimorpha longicaudata]|uniref:procollagen C-endopeptidase enhancer 2-like n=1 Tax=Diachasmimorpha longicaudata TaxID=58733 RepID=UPI0030B87AAA